MRDEAVAVCEGARDITHHVGGGGATLLCCCLMINLVHVQQLTLLYWDSTLLKEAIGGRWGDALLGDIGVVLIAGGERQSRGLHLGHRGPRGGGDGLVRHGVLGHLERWGVGCGVVLGEWWGGEVTRAKREEIGESRKSFCYCFFLPRGRRVGECGMGLPLVDW